MTKFTKAQLADQNAQLRARVAQLEADLQRVRSAPRAKPGDAELKALMAQAKALATTHKVAVRIHEGQVQGKWKGEWHTARA